MWATHDTAQLISPVTYGITRTFNCTRLTSHHHHTVIKLPCVMWRARCTHWTYPKQCHDALSSRPCRIRAVSMRPPSPSHDTVIQVTATGYPFRGVDSSAKQLFTRPIHPHALASEILLRAHYEHRRRKLRAAPRHDSRHEFSASPLARGRSRTPSLRSQLSCHAEAKRGQHEVRQSSLLRSARSVMDKDMEHARIPPITPKL